MPIAQRGTTFAGGFLGVRKRLERPFSKVAVGTPASAAGRLSVVVFGEEICEKARRVVQEVGRDVHSVDARPGGRHWSVDVEFVDRRAGAGHQQR